MSGTHKGTRDGRLAVFCWCGRKIRHVPQKTVRAGLTASCGTPGCEETP